MDHRKSAKDLFKIRIFTIDIFGQMKKIKK